MSKKPPKGELSAIAHDVLSSLDGIGKTPEEMAQELAKEPAGMRRDLFDVLGERAKAKKGRRDSSAIVALLSPVVSPGPGNKPDFPQKYVRSIFDCAVALAGEQAGTVTSTLFMTLVSATEKEAEKAKGSSALHFDSLASIDSFIAAFDAALSNDRQSADLARSRAFWSPLVPEIAARGKIPLSQASAVVLVSLLNDVTYSPPAAVRLSIAPLTKAFASSPCADDQRPQEGGGNTGVPPVPPAPTWPKLLPEVEKFADVLGESLRKLSGDLDARLANQSKLIQRIESERMELAGQLDQQSANAASLRDEKARLNEQIGSLQFQLAEFAKQRDLVQAELDKYRTTHDVVISGAESREQDAVNRTKRELVEKQLLTLRSIRDCIAELGRTHAHERAVRQAATNFNNFARFLANGNYTAQGDLEKIQILTSQGSDAP